MRKLKHLLEAAIVYLVFGGFALLPLDTASAMGGWLARRIGPLLAVHRTAEKNLRRALPEMTNQQYREVLAGMWDNLGRTVAEYPHLSSAAMRARVEVDERSRQMLREIAASGKGAIFFTGHFANWELAARAGYDHGMPLVLIYRPANNPYVDWLIRRVRMRFCTGLYPKGISGAAQVIRTLRAGDKVGMLVDQKMNDGIPVPFFGRDAMTASATAELSLKYGVPVIPVRVVRGTGAQFRFELLPPLETTRSDDRKQDVLAFMMAINAQLEQWVREHPAQWFWVHKRWGNSA